MHISLNFSLFFFFYYDSGIGSFYFSVMIAVAVPSELGWLSVNGISSTGHRVRPGRFGSVDRTISVDCEIESERNNSCLRHNPHEIDSDPILEIGRAHV